MLGVGDIFPDFNLMAVRAGDVNGLTLETAFDEVSSSHYLSKWKVIFFYPKDFTFVCPTEISKFSQMDDEFKARDAQVLGCSVDSEYVHLAWRKSNPLLKNLQFPLLSDIKRTLSEELGILDNKTGVTNRAVFIVDPEQIIRFLMVTDMNVGRNVGEVLRILDALKSGGLCGCDWSKGEKNLEITG